jgi:signal transduction histidine kinase
MAAARHGAMIAAMASVDVEPGREGEDADARMDAGAAAGADASGEGEPRRESASGADDASGEGEPREESTSGADDASREGEPREESASGADDASGGGEAEHDAATGASEPDRPRLHRHPERGLLGGVCAGIAEWLGVNVTLVRVVVAIVVAIGGIGLAFYALAWALIPVAPESHGLQRPEGAWREAALIVLIVAVGLVALRASGLHFKDGVVWPLILGAFGLALVWRGSLEADADVEADGGRRLSLREQVRRASRVNGSRVATGALLVAFAAATLLHTFGVLHSLGKAIGAVAIVATVLALLAGPWLVRLVRSLASERAARIREQERAELAAHLHDSVLQTLALIQKRAGDPREVAGLARRQERELRRWLHEGPPRGGQETVAAALARNAAEVEELHRVPIEVVTVGDGPLDAPLEAIVQAAREAMTNAAKFAGSDHVDLYAEVERDRVEVFVRDRGVGFDAEAIPEDRRGVRDSIIGRVERHGGRAAVRSTCGEGTEVELAMGRGAVA